MVYDVPVLGWVGSVDIQFDVQIVCLSRVSKYQSVSTGQATR